MTTMAAVDRLVHHAIILEFDGETRRVPRPKDKGEDKPSTRARQPLRAPRFGADGAKDSAPPQGLAQGLATSQRTKETQPKVSR